MPTLRQSTQVTNNVPAVSANGNEPIVIVGDYTTVAGIAAADVIEMVRLPANYVPVDVIVAAEDLDSNGAPTVTLDCGVISGTAGAADNTRTCGNEGFAASTVGQAGGVARMDKAALAMLAPTTADRGFGLKLAAGAATLVVGAKIRLTLTARPVRNGV